MGGGRGREGGTGRPPTRRSAVRSLAPLIPVLQDSEPEISASVSISSVGMCESVEKVLYECMDECGL